MPSKPRRSFTAEQKAAILRRHLVDKVPISQLCEENGIQPSLFYYWQRQVFENLENSLQPPTNGREKELERENEVLRQSLAKKDEVIAWVTAEHVRLKKTLGEP